MSDESADSLDVSDLARHMGVPIMPGELREPVTTNDIRRWVQAMHYPNPLHYDEGWAAESRFGRLVAPQSFTVATDTSHGCLNVSPSNAEWFYDHSKSGDIVEVINTVGSTLPATEGLGDWNMPWPQWKAGNANT